MKNMIASSYLYFRPQRANLGFGYSTLKKNNTFIYLEGSAEHRSFSSAKICTMNVYEADREYKFERIINPIDEDNNEKTLCFGHATLIMPDIYTIKEEFIEVTLHMKTKDFEKLKYFVDKSFFPQTGELSIYLTMPGMEPGDDPAFDEFPPEKSIPVIESIFGLKSNKIENQQPLIPPDHIKIR